MQKSHHIVGNRNFIPSEGDTGEKVGISCAKPFHLNTVGEEKFLQEIA